MQWTNSTTSPLPLSITYATTYASESYVDPILVDKKDMLLDFLTATVPVTISLPIIPLMSPRITVISKATIPARSDDLKYPPPHELVRQAVLNICPLPIRPS